LTLEDHRLLNSTSASTLSTHRHVDINDGSLCFFEYCLHLVDRIFPSWNILPPPLPSSPSLYSLISCQSSLPSPCLLLSSPYFLCFWFRLLIVVWLSVYFHHLFSLCVRFHYGLSLCVFRLRVSVSVSAFVALVLAFRLSRFASRVSPLLVSRSLVSLLPSALSRLCLSCFHLSRLC